MTENVIQSPPGFGRETVLRRIHKPPQIYILSSVMFTKALQQVSSVEHELMMDGKWKKNNEFQINTYCIIEVARLFL